MHQHKFILALCVAIIVSAVYIRYDELKIAREKQIAHMQSAAADAPIFDENILIDDAALEKAIATPTPTSISTIPTPSSTPRVAVVKPYITAMSYLVGNLETGEIYLDLDSKKALPIASVSKLYTSLVVHHLFKTDDLITITKPMLEPIGDAGHLVENEKLTPEELLYPLLMESSNDAALAFATSFGYSKFIAEMNAFAQEIGMRGTVFQDPSGLTQFNISTASDLFTLTQYLYKNEPEILAITRTGQKVLEANENHPQHALVNINPYYNYPNFIGGKTGRTDQARETMVSLFNQEIGGKTYPIVVIILRSDIGQREIDTEKLLGKLSDKLSGVLGFSSQ